MNYKFDKTKIDSDKIKYTFGSNKALGNLSFEGFINLLKEENTEFLKTFREALNDATTDFGAYFWKCIPVSKNTLNKDFEFVVIKNESLNNMTQDYQSFKEYLSKTYLSFKPAISFPNKKQNHDAILVIPDLVVNKDKTTHLDFKNISQFTKNAPNEQQQEFWKEVANKLSEELEKNSDTPRWLNTHGLGVSYLHVRIDEKPKYYSDYPEYQTEKPFSPQDKPNNPDKPNDNGKDKPTDQKDLIEAQKSARKEVKKMLADGKINKSQSEKYQNEINQATSPTEVDSLLKKWKASSSSQPNSTQPEKNNILKYLGISALVLLLLIVIFCLLSKKKKNKLEYSMLKVSK